MDNLFSYLFPRNLKMIIEGGNLFMTEKFINSRIQLKVDTAENWGKAENFIPLEGELILYSDTQQIKLGDGITKVNNLPVYIENAKIQ